MAPPSDLDRTFDLNDLCQQSGVTTRTVRYYVQQGLLPSPGLGAGARYGEGHLVRLRLIRRLQAEHLPLAEIRRRMEGLDDQAVRALLEKSSVDPTAPTSAVDYVRQVLGDLSASPPGSPRPGPPAPPASPARPASASSSSAPGGPARLPGADRAQWERIALTSDVEVHVRRPLSREDNRRLEKLLEKGRELFRGEEV
jgi:DNA-binding transcriptional MerR regulator